MAEGLQGRCGALVYRCFLVARYDLVRVYLERETVHTVGRDGAVFAVITARQRED